MNKKYIIGIIVILLMGGTYAGYEIFSDNNGLGSTLSTTDMKHIFT